MSGRGIDVMQRVGKDHHVASVTGSGDGVSELDQQPCHRGLHDPPHAVAAPRRPACSRASEVNPSEAVQMTKAPPATSVTRSPGMPVSVSPSTSKPAWARAELTCE